MSSESEFANMNTRERLGFDPADLKVEPMAEFDFEAMRNDPAMYYIQIAVRSGLDPEDLEDEEKEFMHLVYGDDWRDELMYSIENMSEAPVEQNREDAMAAMKSFLEKAKAKTDA